MDDGEKKPNENRKLSPINGQPVPVNLKGRGKGVPNKRTIMAREAIADFVDGNAERLTGWLDKVAEDKPEEAFRLFMMVVEYHIPKLQRQEQQMLDADGNPAESTQKIEVVFVNQRDTNPNRV